MLLIVNLKVHKFPVLHAYESSFDQCRHAYLIPYRQLGKLKITVVINTATMIATIYQVLLHFCDSIFPLAHLQGIPCLGLLPFIECLVICSVNMRHTLIGWDEEGCWHHDPYSLQSENALYSLKKIQRILEKVELPSEWPPVVSMEKLFALNLRRTHSADYHCDFQVLDVL